MCSFINLFIWSNIKKKTNTSIKYIQLLASSPAEWNRPINERASSPNETREMEAKQVCIVNLFTLFQQLRWQKAGKSNAEASVERHNIFHSSRRSLA